MFWDGFLDEMKGWISYDIFEWIVASALVALLATKLIKNLSGSLDETGQEIRFLVATFLICVAIFYIP